jgi:hypothetical protein
MWDTLLNALKALQKPHAVRATLLIVIIALTVTLAPKTPQIVDEVIRRGYESDCSDTIFIVQAISWYTTPQLEESLRSFLLQYYKPSEHGVSAAEVRTLMELKISRNTNQIVKNLNSLQLCVPAVGDWYGAHFDQKSLTDGLTSLIMLELDYNSASEREQVISRIISLMQAAVRSHQEDTNQQLLKTLEAGIL